MSEVGSTVPNMAEIGTDWRVLDGVATAWFDAPSLTEGAALAGRVVELSAETVVDVRATGCGCASTPTSTPRRCRRPRGISGWPRTLLRCST